VKMLDHLQANGFAFPIPAVLGHPPGDEDRMMCGSSAMPPPTGSRSTAMPAQDFDRWNGQNHRWEGEKAQAAREAWLAAEAQTLDPRGRPLPEVVALEVLRGEHASLGVLADWLSDQGLLEPAFRERVERVRSESLDAAWRLVAGAASDFNCL